MNAKEWFSDFARGTTLGTGMLPGVSVGTVGIIVNVYDKLIGAIDGLRKKQTFLSSLIALLPIAIGCLISTFLIMLFWKKVAYVYFPFIIVSALAGFILGALPIMLAEFRGQKFSPADYLRMLIGFVVAAGIGLSAYLSAAGVLPLDMNFSAAMDDPFHNIWILIIILVVGFLAAVSCLVPGISGSMVMFIFGLYNPILNLFFNEYDPVTGATIHESIFHDHSKLGGGVTEIAVLLVGMLVGFLAVSKLMKSLLANHRRGTFGVIVGFVLGSVVSMFFNNDMYAVYHTERLTAWYQFAIGGLVFALVLLATFLLVRRAQQRAKDKEKAE